MGNAAAPGNMFKALKPASWANAPPPRKPSTCAVLGKGVLAKAGTLSCMRWVVWMTEDSTWA